MLNILETKKGVIFKIWVQPRSSKQELAGIQDDALKLRIKAPPVDGKANEECIRFLSELFGVRKSRISIISGLTSRGKTVSIEGLKKKDIESAVDLG
jgi:uncharacterized protein (TIGR00251 family)